LIAPRGLAPLAGLGRFPFETQALMRAAEVIPRSPPLQVGLQGRGELGGGPGAAGQGREALAQGQVEAFDESGVDGTGEAELLKGDLQVFALAELHAPLDFSELTAAIGFDDLAVEQVERHLPFRFAGGGVCEPLAKVSGEGIEVQVQSIAGASGHTAWGQGQRRGVD
jgi:hypothetical protein